MERKLNSFKLKRVLMVILFVLPLMLFAQNRSLNNFTDANGLKQGTWKVRHESSQAIRYIGQFKDNKPYGLFKYYYKSGVLSAVMEFNNNRSSVTMYHENGIVMSVGKYQNQLKDSVWYFFNNRNELLSSEDYENDYIHGKQFLYYPVDPNKGEIKIMEMYHYNLGNKHGAWEHYHESGHLKSKGKYNNGYLQGEVFYYYTNGQIDLRGFYKKGKKNGLWTYYNENGAIDKEVNYKEDKLLKGKELEIYLEKLKAKKTKAISE